MDNGIPRVRARPLLRLVQEISVQIAIRHHETKDKTGAILVLVRAWRQKSPATMYVADQEQELIKEGYRGQLVFLLMLRCNNGFNCVRKPNKKFASQP
jgi:hypothetical protein